MRLHDGDGNEISMWSEEAQAQLAHSDRDKDDDDAESNSSDDETEDVNQPLSFASVPDEPEETREGRKAAKKARKLAAASKHERQVQVGDMPSDSDDDDDDKDVPANANHQDAASETKNVATVSATGAMAKLALNGKNDDTERRIRDDLARLAEVRRKRALAEERRKVREDFDFLLQDFHSILV
jgi:hypothetical protein